MADDDKELLKRVARVLRQAAEDFNAIAGEVERQVGANGIDARAAMERSCQGKRAYATAERAGAAAESRNVPGLRVYECPFCRQFHLTSRTLDAFAARP
jgi:hypothetical protein